LTCANKALRDGKVSLQVRHTAGEERRRLWRRTGGVEVGIVLLITV